ncbi:MAG: EamA family transporter RarD [Acidimicrobiales bacterium]
MTTTSRAILLVVVADVWWGISAIYWNELDDLDSIDQLGWRIVLGLATLSVYWIARRTFPFAGTTGRHVRFAMAGALAISGNWAVFLWAGANGQAVEAALGYFLMPIISVALALKVLGERLRRAQVVAVLLALVGIVWLFASRGGVPWVALVLGFSFASYGLLRKVGPWGALDGLTAEMTVVAPIGAILLLTGVASGRSVDGGGGATNWLLISITGLVTTLPLFLFANAARKAPLVVVGLLQYVIPVAQFLVGWLWLGESVDRSRLFGFGFIWAALGFVVADQVGSGRAGAVSEGPVDRLEPRLE